MNTYIHPILRKEEKPTTRRSFTAPMTNNLEHAKHPHAVKTDEPANHDLRNQTVTT